MLTQKLLKYFREVPHELVVEAAEMVGGDNGYKQLLYNVEIFRKANVEPVILSNNDQSTMVVTSRETMNSKKLH